MSFSFLKIFLIFIFLLTFVFIFFIFCRLVFEKFDGIRGVWHPTLRSFFTRYYLILASYSNFPYGNLLDMLSL
jgi:hypothetical protein